MQGPPTTSARPLHWLASGFGSPAWFHRPSRFTVLSRYDAAFPLILSETIRKIGIFAGESPSDVV
jgi:hypothetical protein